jgi:tRNA dimethylallyltransferase
MQTSSSQIALIGPTASGKSAVALEIAAKYRGVILSLDSLAIYRGINIASAKPTPEERGEIPHYGIDLINPDDSFDVLRFVKVYQEARRRCDDEKRPLLIVGGSAFYLKILLEGISPLPPIDSTVHRNADRLLRDPREAMAFLNKKAPNYAKKIAPSDRYRIEKALLILLQTGLDPLDYFRLHPPDPVIDGNLPLFEIVVPRDKLRERIRRRTDAMLGQGLIDEIAGLEARYGRAPHSMKAIGIVEVLSYFDGRYDYAQMREKIVTHTARLAKRQQTFNRSQFDRVIRGEKETLRKEIENYLRSFR